MAVQRRTDVLLDSVTRLLRVGASANLLNLLQKQHPTDVAEILNRLPPHYRRMAFDTIAEHNPRMAMQALSELEPDQGAALLTHRSVDDVVKLLRELPILRVHVNLPFCGSPVSASRAERRRLCSSASAGVATTTSSTPNH